MDNSAQPIRRPTRKEIDFYYKTHRSSFYAAERVRVLQIVKNVDELCPAAEARAVLQRAEKDMEAGADFGDVAARYSDCPANGGGLGWVERETMVEEFESVLFDCAVGETSGIFETRFGLHIVHILERMPAGVRPLREVYEEIAEELMARRETVAQMP